PQLARAHVGNEHLVVALPLVLAGIGVVAVGLYPEPALRVEAEPVRTVEHDFRRDRRRAGTQVALVRILPGVAAEQEDVPGEIERRRIVAGLVPANDVAPQVVGPRVGRIHGRTGGARDRAAVGRIDAGGIASAPVVVRQRAIDLAGAHGVGRDPLGTV